MSYLGPLRLHFAGQFQADPSTVNNDVRHFDNASFERKDQHVQPTGSWRPDGTGAFRLIGCKVTAVSFGDGTFSKRDRVVGSLVADANTRVSAKIVDLDPQQQLASQIWGLIVRLTDGEHDFFRGPFEATSFSDIWGGRAQGAGPPGDMAMSTYFQSVIGPVAWGDRGGSKFLLELRRAARDGMLSMKFNLDGYNMNPAAPGFTLGRIVGTIGPASPDEPKHFVNARQLFPQLAQGSPAGLMNFMPAVVDRPTRRVIADFGNAFPTARPGGPMHVCGSVELGYLDDSNTFHSLGRVAYTKPDWYETTAGIQAFPRTRTLSDPEWKALKKNRLAVAQEGQVILQENFDGLHARADRFVFRLEPGENAEVQIWATQYGRPLAKAKLIAFRDTSGLQPSGEGSAVMKHPPAFGVPESTLAFPKQVVTGKDGRATLSIKASDPGRPRGYIDGQVFGVRYLLAGLAKRVKKNPAFGLNPWDFVSIRVYDVHHPKHKPTWYHLEPIFRQYGNLYPVMSRIVDMHSYESVAANAHLLAFSFALPMDDPNHMPVTRDLSRGKRETILRWLTHRPGGMPVLGKPPKHRRVRRPKRYFTGDRQAAAAGRRARGAKTLAVETRGVIPIPDED